MFVRIVDELCISDSFVTITQRFYGYHPIEQDHSSQCNHSHPSGTVCHENAAILIGNSNNRSWMVPSGTPLAGACLVRASSVVYQPIF